MGEISEGGGEKGFDARGGRGSERLRVHSLLLRGKRVLAREKETAGSKGGDRNACRVECEVHSCRRKQPQAGCAVVSPESGQGGRRRRGLGLPRLPTGEQLQDEQSDESVGYGFQTRVWYQSGRVL